MKKSAVLLLITMMCIQTLIAVSPPYLTIPFKQDPPISVDGELDDWADVPVKIALDSQNDQLKLRKKFTGKFNADVMLSWKPEGVYVAVNAFDNTFVNGGTGINLFNGDHVELFIDTDLNTNGTNTAFGEGQFHIGISPGNFKDLSPEICCAFPIGKKLADTRCASRKTADGWIVEAYIPWSSLDRKQIQRHSIIGFNLWVCNTVKNDGDKLSPSCILTTGKADAVFRNRADLKQTVFADAEGKTTTVIKSNKPIKLADKIVLAPQESRQFTFPKPSCPAYLTPVLKFRATLIGKTTFGGYAKVLMIKLNDTYFNDSNLIIPENNFITASGKEDTIFQSGKGFLLPYTNDGKAASLPENTKRFFKKHYDMHSFVFSFQNSFKAENNILLLKNNISPKTNFKMELTDIRIDYEPASLIRKRRPAPTGPLPLITPKEVKPFSAAISHTGNRISFKYPHGTDIVTSRFSTPDGKWSTESNKFFKHSRSVERKTEVLVIKDIFTNLTEENLPIIQQHTVIPADKELRLYTCGIESTATAATIRSHGNYSVFGGGKNSGVGLYPINVEFQLHAGTLIPAPGRVTLTDDQLVLPPKGSITQEFIAVPVKNGGYFDFVNAARRHLGANVILDGPYGSLSNQNWFKPFLKRINIFEIKFPLVNLPRIGISFLTSPQRPAAKAQVAQIRKMRPQAKIFRYFHSQIEAEAAQVYPDRERVLLKNGKQALYGGGTSRLFLTLEGGEYAKMMENVIDDLLNNWNLDGIYWDEFNSSGEWFHYGDPWDKCSGDIDPRTHKISRLKSSVFLLQRPWKNRMADKINASGKIFYTNGGSARMGEFAKKIAFTFTETEIDSNNARVHFTTPLAHANSNGQMSMVDLYNRFLVSLKYGVLPNYASISVPHRNAYNTFVHLCYPSTPIELQQGCVFAKERIVTKNSGAYTWNDNSEHEVRVFDHDGCEVKHNMKTFTRDGKTITEIRLPENWCAVIIRKQKSAE